jgi:hypothetical protein
MLDQKMLDASQPSPTHHPDHQDDTAAQAGGSLMARISDTERHRIYLPRGSAQSRFEPPSYYYDASDSGVVPRWAVDRACRKDA